MVDLQAAMDYVVSIGLADPDRLGVGGWSYGGILTDAIIARTSLQGRYQRRQHGVPAFDVRRGSVCHAVQRRDRATLESGSGTVDEISYGFLHADQIKTPTLFLGGDKDFNVPLVGGEQMYEALRSLGVPTELVIYPGQFHGFTRPSYIKDRLRRYLGWFDRYLAPAN